MESSETIPSSVYKEILHSWLVKYFANQHASAYELIIISPLLSSRVIKRCWFHVCVCLPSEAIKFIDVK